LISQFSFPNECGPKEGQLRACFILDSLEAIISTLKHAAMINQSGGG